MLGERYREALSFVAELHRGQRRKGSQVDYLAHLLSVSALVMEHGGDEDEAIAALLHDAIEDQGNDYSSGSDGSPRDGRAALRQAIDSRFGARVLQIVDACTDDEHFEKPAAGERGNVEAWKQRKAHHIALLADERDSSVLRVACADKLHNARTMLVDWPEHGDAFWDRFRGRTKANQIWYYRGMAEAIRRNARPGRDAGLIRLVDELDRVLDRIESTIV
jgi:(p)ppGpp synthase/HD superfamily hydrolase